MIKKTEKNIRTAWYDKAIRICIYLIIIAVPVIFSPWFYTVFSAPKLLVLRLLTLAIFFFWGCKIFVEERVSYRRSPINWFLLLYGAVSVLTAVMTIAPFTSLYGAEGRFLGIFTILNFLVLPVIALNFLDKKSPKKIAIISIITACVISVYGLTQYAGYFNDYFYWSDNPSERVFATIGHANHLGAYLGMNILLAVFLFPYIKKNKRILLGAGLILMTVVLILTASRGSIFATLLALLICALVVTIKKWKEIKGVLKNRNIKTGVVIAIIMAAISLTLGAYKGLPLIERTVRTVSFINEGNIPDRLSWWMSTFQMIKDRPVTGFGLSTYRDIYNNYRRADYKVDVPGDMQDYITPEAAHNEYLNIAATQGLIGLAAFLGIIFFVLWRVDKVTLLAKKTDKNLFMVMGYKGAMLVYLLQVFVSFGVIATMTMLFIFIGLLVLMADKKEEFKTLQLNKFYVIPLTVLIAVLCAAGGYYAVQEARAEISYKNAYIASAKGDLKQAIESYQETVLLKPFEYAYRQAFADFALKNASAGAIKPDVQLKLLMLAEASYDSATAINNYHPSTYYNMGLSQLAIYGMTKNEVYLIKALKNMNRSVDLAVNNPLYAYQSGKALVATNNPYAQQQGKVLLKKAAGMREGNRDAAAP
jgi:O-antigen ligase